MTHDDKLYAIKQATKVYVWCEIGFWIECGNSRSAIIEKLNVLKNFSIQGDLTAIYIAL